MSRHGGVVAGSLIFSAIVFWATGTRAGDFREWTGRAAHLAVISITSGSAVERAPHRACSFTYRLRIDRNLRGSAPREIYTDAELKVGGRYLLVYAEAATWASREFAADVPLPLSETERPRDCDKLRGEAALVRGAELRPIRRALGQTLGPSGTGLAGAFEGEWVEFPALVFPKPSSLSFVSDGDRVEIVSDQIAWPPLYLHDYVLLSDLIDSARKVHGDLR